MRIKFSPAAAKLTISGNPAQIPYDLRRPLRIHGFWRKLGCVSCSSVRAGVVGTCKLDTHGFNTNDLQKIKFYFEIFIFFSKNFRPKQKIVFRKISKSDFFKISKSKISTFSRIRKFRDFFRKHFLFWSKKNRKNKISKIKIYFL